MRILSMINSLAETGGIEMLVRNLTLEYARRGHACHIVYISDAASLGTGPAHEKAFLAQLDAAGVGHTRLGHDAKRHRLRGAWRLRRAIRAFRPDVFHVHLGYGLLFQALGLVRVPTVYTHHNTVFTFPTKMFRIFDRFVARYIAICAACDELLERHVSRPIVRIYNGVPATFRQAAARDRPSRDLTVLSVGNLTPQKDYATLVAAAALLVPQLEAAGRTVEFLIAGDGDERDAIARDIEARGLSGHIRLLGARSDVPALMAGADVLALSSRFEGFPLTLIEAAMSGLPAVATDVGGCAEIVADGETGLLVPPGDPNALAEAISALLSDEARYVAFSAAARARAQRFGLAQCVDAHLALYAEIAKP